MEIVSRNFSRHALKLYRLQSHMLLFMNVKKEIFRILLYFLFLY